MADDVNRFVYDEAMRSLDHQRQTLESLRGRTAMLLSAAAIATSFLGGVALGDGEVGPAGVVSIVLFAVAGSLCAWILLPRPGWMFSWRARTLLGNYFEASEPVGLAQAQRDLAIHAEDNFRKNSDRIKYLMFVYIAATVGVIAGIVGWVIEI